MGTYQVESVNAKAVVLPLPGTVDTKPMVEAGSTLPHPAPHVFQIIFCFYLAFEL